MHDSGKRQEFTTGAVRDTAAGKPRLGLISPFAMRRLGHWLTLGASKYAERNWEKGMPYSRVLDSLERHVAAWKAGERDEDHLAAVMCNAMFLMHYEAMVERSVLPAELDDMPDYGPPDFPIPGDEPCRSTLRGLIRTQPLAQPSPAHSPSAAPIIRVETRDVPAAAARSSSGAVGGKRSRRRTGN